MIREILRMGDERLLKMAPPVPPEKIGTEELHTLVNDMFETMRASGGVGLAAPQIGVDLQLMVFAVVPSDKFPERPEVAPCALLNPIVTVEDETLESDWEGCLSIPGLRAKVDRYATIRYQGIDPDGQPIDVVADGLHARIVQHEHDHLIGRLYPSRITDFTTFGFNEEIANRSKEM
ncbi:Peptide deformylase [Halomonadaceae bacterium LMG 33818]